MLLNQQIRIAHTLHTQHFPKALIHEHILAPLAITATYLIEVLFAVILTQIEGIDRVFGEDF